MKQRIIHADSIKANSSQKRWLKLWWRRQGILAQFAKMPQVELVRWPSSNCPLRDSSQRQKTKLGKSTISEHPLFLCFASKVTEIGRISVVMYVSDQFVDAKMQLTHYRDPSTKLGFCVGTRLKRQKTMQKRQNIVSPPCE